MDLSILPDEELLNRFKESHNPDFFSELMRRYEPYVLKKCCQHLKSKDDAQDVSQEVFLRLFTKSHTYKSDLPFKPWLNRIISNRCIDHLKKDKTALHQEISSKITGALAEELRITSVKRPTTEILEELLEQVSGQDKLILTMKYKQHWSIEQIARALNLNENTVKSRLKRSREKLQKLLADYTYSASAV